MGLHVLWVLYIYGIYWFSVLLCLWTPDIDRSDSDPDIARLDVNPAGRPGQKTVNLLYLDTFRAKYPLLQGIIFGLRPPKSPLERFTGGAGCQHTSQCGRTRLWCLFCPGGEPPGPDFTALVRQQTSDRLVGANFMDFRPWPQITLLYMLHGFAVIYITCIYV